MKIRTLMVVLFASLFALPALACGPMPSGGSSGGSSYKNPGRKKWAKKRIKQLKGKMSDYHKAQQWSDGLGYATGEMVPQVRRNAVEHRQFLIHRYEFLALKAEYGKASITEQIEMRALQSYLLNGGQ